MNESFNYNTNNIAGQKKSYTRYIIAILLAIVLLLGGYIIYDKFIKVDSSNKSTENGKNDQNNNENDNKVIKSKVNSELSKAVLFDIKLIGGEIKKIVAVTSDKKEIELADISQYNGGAQYDYYDGKLYLYLYNAQSVDNILAYIDLNSGNGNYQLKVIKDLGNMGGYASGFPASIAALKDTIYYVSSGFAKVKKYTISTGTIEDTNITQSGQLVQLESINDNTLIYNSGLNLSVLNIDTNEIKQVDTNSQLSFVLNNKVVYYKYEPNNHDKYTYYEYGISNGKTTRLSNVINRVVEAEGNSFIIPYNNGYVYANQKDLQLYSNGQISTLYSFNSDIGIMELLSDKDLHVANEGAVIDGPANNPFSVIYNINTKTATVSNLNYSYQYTKYIY